MKKATSKQPSYSNSKIQQEDPQRPNVWGQLGFNPQDYVNGQLTVQKVEYFKEIFDFLDSNGNGVLQPIDLRNLVKLGGYQPKKEQIYHMLSDYDKDESGIVEFDEFLKIMTSKPCEDDTEHDIKKSFDFFDHDGKGYITQDDLKLAAEEHHDGTSEEDIAEMVKTLDPSGKGHITWEEFLKFNSSSEW